MGIWHYTTGECLLRILMDGEIRPAIERVSVGERPIVWFSTHPLWEPSATKTVQDENGTIREATMEEMEQLGGLARIEVAPGTAPYGWKELKRVSAMKNSTARGLERAARRVRSFTDDWRGAFNPVPRERWLAIEVFQGGAWVPFAAAERTPAN